MRQRESDLQIVELSGTARGGKGSIANHLKNTRDRLMADETGADYRILTKTLLHERLIEQGMPKDILALHMARVSFGYLSDIVTKRHDIVEQFGHESLYENEVNETVSLVGAVPDARKAVKTGFRRRVEAVRDNDEVDILVVDGRNLASVVETIPDTRIMLRAFVSCSAEEAARRECMRQAIEFTSPEGAAVAEAIRRRNENDATRTLDPVQPDADAIDYWNDLSVFAQTFNHLVATRFKGNFELAIEKILITEQENYSRILRVGAGALAATSGRQILFDTGGFRERYDDPYRAMLDAADLMFDEAQLAAQTLSRTAS